MTTPVHTEASRALLAWVADRVRYYDQDEAHESDRGRFDAYKAIAKELGEHLATVETEAVRMALGGHITYADATVILEERDRT